MHLAEVKGPVMDRLQRSELLALLAPGKVFLSTYQAVSELTRKVADSPNLDKVPGTDPLQGSTAQRVAKLS